MLWTYVLVRVLSNPVGNAFQKVLTRRGLGAMAVILATHLVLAMACTPLLLLGVIGRPGDGFWLNIWICAALAVTGNGLLVEAVKRTDLSVLGPINAYKAIVSLVPGMLLLGEFPGPVGGAGMAMIVAGSYFIVDRDVKRPDENAFVRFFNDRGIQLRLAALVLSAVEAVFLKRAILCSSPVITFAWWSVLGLVVSIPAVLVLERGSVHEHAKSGARTVGMVLLTAGAVGLMQLTTLLTFRSVPVGYGLALFQTSSLISVLLGHHFFDEGKLWERLGGCGIMIAGATLIGLAR